MRAKGFIYFLLIFLAIAVLYHLSFTFVSKKIESDAEEYSKGDETLKKRYFDSIANLPVYNLLIKNFTYRQVQERELNFGLDLKGGLNVTLEIYVPDILRHLAHNTTDTIFNKALALAKEMQKHSRKDFLTLFYESLKKIKPDATLASYFYSKSLNINFNTPDEEVLKILSREIESTIDNSYKILKNRIDRFGVVQPNIRKSDITGRIILELPGVKDPDRIRKLLQGTAYLEFMTTYENEEVFQYLEKANDVLAEILDTLKSDVSQNESLDTTKANDVTKEKEFKKKNPLFSILYPNVDRQGRLLKGSVVGLALGKDTSTINKYLSIPRIKSIFPSNLKFYWSFKPIKGTEVFQLYAIKIDPRLRKAPLDGTVITTARVDFNNITNEPEVTMSMNAEGSKEWARLTRENIGKQIAIILDGYVYSAPVVRQEIKGGNSSISGGFTLEEATDLANVLNSGKLPCPTNIIEESVVGPTLGKESIKASSISFVFALIIVILYMYLFYSKAGLVANITLIANGILLIGVLASLGAILTLPGVAGIILTLGMAIDANIIIYERIREELKEGKGIKLAISDGYKNSYSAIIDANLTTLITGIILYALGSGPIKGFATTLSIGIITSLFSSIFITRLIFERMLKNNKSLKFETSLSSKILNNTNYNFIDFRKYPYLVSSFIIVICAASIIFKGLTLSSDFLGGRTYIVRFDKDIKVSDVRLALAKVFNEAPEVKTFGSNNQIKITTKYLISDVSSQADSIVLSKIYQGLKPLYNKEITFEEFVSFDYNPNIGVMSSTKVGPTIADDVKIGALIAFFFALIGIFSYITFRFKKWQMALGAIIALFHDSLIVLGCFSLFDKILPFNLEVDQAFVAAILTVIGYSINDTVIIFDKIRENITTHPLWDLKFSFNTAINSTLRRTLNTSISTLLVLLIVFIFGGEILRGFIFAIMIGIFVGTYSSIFVASAISYEILSKNKRKESK